ncbi:hypothetical protein HPB48_022380 [Haemaphysalis longicornis]|uniref:Uncharacterized protein n=1 Tax=Haemaphysalis longicornis TaxID=44386 RepID=A0A9J6H1R9_HAELO|nr:hypothetical protein HPB48_022380 [Haemaphysalis longicornis]
MYRFFGSRDFHEYACSGEARRPSLREDALGHFLVEVQAVLGKWGQRRWLTKTPPIHAKFYRSCHGSSRALDTLEHDLGQFLSQLDRTHRLPEAWAADVSRTLQLFPIFEMDVARLDDVACVVLREPETFDSDFVFGMPSIASHAHVDFVNKLSPSYAKHVFSVMKNTKAESVRAYFSYVLHLHLWPFWARLEGDQRDRKQQEFESQRTCALLTYRLFNFAFVKHFNDTARMGVVAKAGMKEAVVRNSYRPPESPSQSYPTALFFARCWRFDRPVGPRSTKQWLEQVVGSGGRVFDTNLDMVCHFDPETKTLGIPLSIAELDVGGREFFLDISTVGLLMARSLYRIFQASDNVDSQLDGASGPRKPGV